MQKVNLIITKRTKQKVNPSELAIWNEHMKYTSVNEIHKAKKISRKGITDLLVTGEGTQGTIDGVREYMGPIIEKHAQK